MKWREWKKWLRDKPWILKWFILLVLLRPVVDNFYYLKEISPLLSPLYIVGVLTPVLCLITIFRYRVRPTTAMDRFFGYWSAMVLMGCVLIFMYDPTALISIEFVLKLSLPVYVYYFLRRFVGSSRDLDGILQTVLYASIIVAIILVYELVSGPIRMEESRGMARIQGNFGDVVSYGIYIALATLAAGYFYFRDKLAHKSTRKSLMNLAIVAFVSMLALFNMHHVASYAVFLAIAGLFAMYNMKVNREVGVFVMIILAGGAMYFGQGFFEESIAPLIETDMQVYAGEQDTERLLHGRMGRWMHMLNLFSEQGIFVQFFGFPLNFEYAFHYIGIGAHNDFIRMLFFTGFVGLLLYLSMLFYAFRRAQKLRESHRFLLIGLLMAVVLYSISTTPTMYAPFIYIVMAVFAFAALPIKTVVRNG